MSADKQVFQFENHQNVLILTPVGPFMEFRDSDIRNAYNEAYRRLLEPGIQHLLVDFSKLDYFGSTFVGILIRLSTKVRMGGGHAFLCHLSDSMKQMMKTLMLLENPKSNCSWSVCGSREEGLQKLAEIVVPADATAKP